MKIDNMKKVTTSILIILLCILEIDAQERTLRLVCFEHAFTDSLICRLSINDGVGRADEYNYPATYNSDKTVCSFSFPDSIFECYTAIEFRKLTSKKPIFSLELRVINEVDTTLFSSGKLFWEEMDTLTLKLKYEERNEYKDYVNHLISERYTIENPTPEVKLSIVSYHNDMMRNRGENREQFYERYKKLIPQHSDSRSLMTNVYSRFASGTVEQQEELFSLFSKKMQQSYIGREWKERILVRKSNFQNMLFENSQTGIKEHIILSTQKYTLVIFSASWCAPCHKLIPILKELYQQKNREIDFVYVSIDQPQTKEAWRKLLIKEQIPWRSLSTNGDSSIFRRYRFAGIPCTFLIYPDGHFKKLDVRDEMDLKALENVHL